MIKPPLLHQVNHSIRHINLRALLFRDSFELKLKNDKL